MPANSSRTLLSSFGTPPLTSKSKALSTFLLLAWTIATWYCNLRLFYFFRNLYAIVIFLAFCFGEVYTDLGMQ